MKTILITILVKNNEKYIPFFKEMIEMVEKDLFDKYVFKYLIYTNNNTDKTLELLQKNKKDNMKIINESQPKEILEANIIIRLYHLREKLLNLTLKEDFDYLLMLDTDIFFNSKIITESISVLENSKFNAISANTLWGNVYPFVSYYDHFSYRDKKGKSLDSKLSRYKFSIYDLPLTFKEIIEVKSSFCGFFLTKKSNLVNKKITYLKNVKESKCEHVDFNQNFKIGLAKNINPLRLLGNEKKDKYEKYLKIIKKNRSDNKRDAIEIIKLISIVLIILIIIYLKFIRSC